MKIENLVMYMDLVEYSINLNMETPTEMEVELFNFRFCKKLSSMMHVLCLLFWKELKYGSQFHEFHLHHPHEQGEGDGGGAQRVEGVIHMPVWYMFYP